MNSTASNSIGNTQSINLIDGIFTPSQASDIVKSMLEKKINFHKLEIASRYEGNCFDECTHDNERLRELRLEKERLINIIKDVRQKGKRLQIRSLVNIKLID